MPFKKPNSRYWKIRRKNLPGYGDSGTLSTRTENKRTAEAMESALEEVAQMGLMDARFYAILDALQPAGPGSKNRSLERGALTLPDLLRYHSERRLPELARRLQDPPLAGAVEELRLATKDRSVQRGLDLLLEYVPARQRGRPVRLTYLRDARTIMRLCHQAEAPPSAGGKGIKRNSVRRTLLRAISKLLRFNFGAAERDIIFADVDFPKENDTRLVRLSREQVARLLACSAATGRRLDGTEHFGAFVRLALVTGGDHSPLCNLRAKDVRIVGEMTGTPAMEHRLSGSIMLTDRKTTARPRTIALHHDTCALLQPLLEGLDPEDKVFPLKSRSYQWRWHVARREAGLPWLRFKDLRHAFAIAAEEAGLSQSAIMGAMGHADLATTRRYQAYAASLDEAGAALVERQLGLHSIDRSNLRSVKAETPG